MINKVDLKLAKIIIKTTKA